MRSLRLCEEPRERVMFVLRLFLRFFRVGFTPERELRDGALLELLERDGALGAEGIYSFFCVYRESERGGNQSYRYIYPI